MFRLERRAMVTAAGGLWAVAGLALGSVGTALLLQGRGLSVAGLFGVALAAGSCKGRFVLVPLVDSNVQRLWGLPGAGRLWQIYPRGTWIFIGCMIVLGITLRWASTAVPDRWSVSALGTIDLAVGVALLVGALRYARALIDGRS